MDELREWVESLTDEEREKLKEILQKEYSKYFDK